MKFFDYDWFPVNIPMWQEHLADALTKPISALEVGSYEGRSAVWILANLHPESKLTCVDTWDGMDATLKKKTAMAEANFDANTISHRGSGRLTKIKADSLTTLAGFVVEGRRFGLIYIDGCHEGLNVMTDLCLGWALLEKGGYMVADDYRWAATDVVASPKEAWDAFAAMKPDMDLVHQFRQCMIRKR